MKSKICMILCACFLMSCMVVPASAAENDNFINVLDYSPANDSGTNYVIADNSATINFTYSIPVGPVRYLDMIIQTVNGPLSSISVNGTALTVLEIKTNFYRVYGSITLSSNLAFSATQLKASTFKSFSTGETGFFALKYADQMLPFLYMDNADSPATHYFHEVDTSADPLEFNYTVYAYPSYWKKYDIIDFYFKVRTSSVDSVAVHFDGIYIPFTLSYFDTESLQWLPDNIYGGDAPLFFTWLTSEDDFIEFMISIDVSNLDRTSSVTPQIAINGKYNQAHVNQYITLQSVVGTVINDSRDSDSYWFMQLYNVIDTFRAYTLHYFRELQTSVSTGFTNIGAWFDDLASSIQTEFTNLKSSIGTHFSNLDTWIKNQTDSIVGSLDDFSANFSNLETWITDQTAAISEEFRLFRSAVSYHFGNLSTWISDQTTALQTEFTDLRSALLSHFKSLTEDLQFSLLNVRAAIGDLTTKLNTWIVDQTTALQTEFSNLRSELATHFSNVGTWITDQTAALEAAIRGDTGPGDAFQDEVDEKDQQLDDMAAVMDSVNKPALDSINVDVSGYVSPSDVSALAAPLLVFITGDVFGPIIIMSILFATVSYVLYGKRG